MAARCTNRTPVVYSSYGKMHSSTLSINHSTTQQVQPQSHTPVLTLACFRQELQHA
jgi:hypothetical protein